MMTDMVVGIYVGILVVAITFWVVARFGYSHREWDEEPFVVRHGLALAPLWPIVAVVWVVQAWVALARELTADADASSTPPSFPPSQVDLSGFAITRDVGGDYRKAAMDEQGARDILDSASAGATHAAAVLIHLAAIEDAWKPVSILDVVTLDDPFVVVWRRNASFQQLVADGYAAWTNQGELVFRAKAYKALADHLCGAPRRAPSPATRPAKRQVS